MSGEWCGLCGLPFNGKRVALYSRKFGWICPHCNFKYRDKSPQEIMSRYERRKGVEDARR